MNEEAEIVDFSAKAPNLQKYDLTKYILDYSSEIVEPVPILMQGDKLVISRGNLSVIAGAPKSRKSMFVAALVASFFGNVTFGLTTCVSVGKCLLFDTESSESHTLKQIKRIYKLLGWTKSNPNLIVFHLRECSIGERIGIIKQAIDLYRPDWAIIDGLLDLTNSANDDTESNMLILELMRITSIYDCHITSILHTGKSNGGQMLGFLGSYAQRKAETVFQLIKEGEDTKVIPAETRNAPFEEFSFLINEEGIPVYNGFVEHMTKAEMNEYNMKHSYCRLLAPNKQMEYEALTIEYSELMACTTRTAKTHLSKLVKIGYILKDTQSKLYRLSKLSDEALQ